MIPPDHTPEPPTKSHPTLLGDSGDTPHDRLPPPPPYPGLASSQSAEEYEPAAKRFLKAFSVATLICIAIASFTGTAVTSTAHWESARGRIRKSFPHFFEGKTISCSSAADGHFVVAPAVPVTTFLVPLSVDLLHVWGRGALSHGTIHFLPTTDRSIPDGNIRVDITPHDYSTEALRSVNICLSEPATNQRSIAILSPRTWLPADDLKFTVVVFFPVHNLTRAPLRVKALETNLPLFTHVFSRLEGHVVFGSLNVYSANKPIRGDRVHAESATIITSNAPIDGTFHISRSLDLQTSNHPIDAEVVLDHDVLAQGGTSTGLSLRTSNALIHSKISLRTTSPSGLGGSFAVSASTQNGAVDLHFPEQPSNSTLSLSARTSGAPATVRLHPAFEGQFDLRTTDGYIEFSPNELAEDPANRERDRSWTFTERTTKAWRGIVAWASADDNGRDPRGRVSVETRNNGVKLQA